MRKNVSVYLWIMRIYSWKFSVLAMKLYLCYMLFETVLTKNRLFLLGDTFFPQEINLRCAEMNNRLINSRWNHWFITHKSLKSLMEFSDKWTLYDTQYFYFNFIHFHWIILENWTHFSKIYVYVLLSLMLNYCIAVQIFLKKAEFCISARLSLIFLHQCSVPIL